MRNRDRKALVAVLPSQCVAPRKKLPEKGIDWMTGKMSCPAVEVASERPVPSTISPLCLAREGWRGVKVRIMQSPSNNVFCNQRGGKNEGWNIWCRFVLAACGWKCIVSRRGAAICRFPVKKEFAGQELKPRVLRGMHKGMDHIGARFQRIFGFVSAYECPMWVVRTCWRTTSPSSWISKCCVGGNKSSERLHSPPECLPHACDQRAKNAHLWGARCLYLPTWLALRSPLQKLHSTQYQRMLIFGQTLKT